MADSPTACDIVAFVINSRWSGYFHETIDLETQNKYGAQLHIINLHHLIDCDNPRFSDLVLTAEQKTALRKIEKDRAIGFDTI